MPTRYLQHSCISTVVLCIVYDSIAKFINHFDSTITLPLWHQIWNAKFEHFHHIRDDEYILHTRNDIYALLCIYYGNLLIIILELRRTENVIIQWTLMWIMWTGISKVSLVFLTRRFGVIFDAFCTQKFVSIIKY